jgi:hypothetical protein
MLSLSLPANSSRAPERQSLLPTAVAILSCVLAWLLSSGWLALIALFAVLLMALEERAIPRVSVKRPPLRAATPAPDGGVNAGLGRLRRAGRAN